MVIPMPIYPYNLKHDNPHFTLDGMLVLRCYFCKTFQTPIEFDMRVHLRDIHQKDLVIRIPEQWLERGKRYNLDERAKILIDHMKQDVPQIFYDHTTAEFTVPPSSG
jgi:hypothetical protein